jgi:DNA-binding MarR family transcriptional regulator
MNDEQRKSRIARCMRRMGRAESTNRIAVEAGMFRSHTSKALHEMRRAGQVTVVPGAGAGERPVMWTLTEQGEELAREHIDDEPNVEWKFDHRALWSAFNMGRFA